MRQKEHAEQSALFAWWQYTAKSIGCDERLLYAIPNGGARNPITGAMLKKEGVRPGIPDIFLAKPSGNWHGMYIEMKTKEGTIQKSQSAMLEILAKEGYCCCVCRGWDEAREKILEYLAK